MLSYATQHTQCMYTKNAKHAKNNIDCMVVFFCMHTLRIRFCDCKSCDRRVACVAYDNLETTCRPMKMDLKVGFQAAVYNATDTTNAGHVMQIKTTAAQHCFMHVCMYEKRNTSKE